MPETARIAYYTQLSAEGPIVAAIESAGFRVEVDDPHGKFSPGIGDWVFEFAVVYPVVRFLEAFVGHAADRASDVVVEKLAQWVRSVAGTYGHGGRGTIVVGTEEQAVDLPSNVSQDALRALLEIDPDGLRGRMEWNETERRWRSNGTGLPYRPTESLAPLPFPDQADT